MRVLRLIAPCFAVVFSFQGLAQTTVPSTSFPPGYSPKINHLTPEETTEKTALLEDVQGAIDMAKNVTELDKAIKILKDTIDGRPEFVADVTQAVDNLVRPARSKLLAKEQAAQQPQKINLYAAVSISSKGAGWARDQKTKEAAEERARKDCGKADCDPPFSFSAGCVGIYRYEYKQGRKRVFGFGASYRPNEDLAKQEAMGRCRVKTATGCTLVTTVCQASK